MPPSSSKKHTIGQSLKDLGVTDFSECSTRDEEFRVLKKHYFRQCLQHHPDKGGDAAIFRQVQTSFELLRDLHNGKRKGRKNSKEWLFSECLLGVVLVGDHDSNSAAACDDDEEEEEAFDTSNYDFSSMPTPSWEYYEEAAEELVAPYRVELAKSGRSKCTQTSKKYKNCADCSPSVNNKDDPSSSLVELADTTAPPEFITKGDLRIGWVNDQTGTYGGWKHLRCWRVPHKVWLGLPDPEQCLDSHQFAAALYNMNDCILSGFPELPQADQRAFVEHCRNKNHWARKTNKRKPTTTADNKTSTTNSKRDTTNTTTAATTKEAHQPDDTSSSRIADNVSSDALVARASTKSSSTAVIAARVRFVMPVPGQLGVSGPNVFQGKTFVLTGVFPEVGGGAGLSLGKSNVKAMIVAFGGRVTGSVSGKTNVLVVGKQPGMSKVSQARARGPKQIVLASLQDLKLGLDTGCPSLEDFPVVNSDEPTMKIESFSKGYSYSRGGHNGLVLEASKVELAIAQGLRPHPNAKLDVTNGGNDKKQPAATTKTTTKRKALKDQVNGAAAATKTKKKQQPARKKTKTAAAKKSQQQIEPLQIITCDDCGQTCTTKSWFVPKNEHDFCPACHAKRPDKEGAVPQVNGENVEYFDLVE
jgi:hypothetical protein